MILPFTVHEDSTIKSQRKQEDLWHEFILDLYKSLHREILCWEPSLEQKRAELVEKK